MPKVKIFESANYAGRVQELAPGRYVKGDLQLGEDTISSVQVPPGWKLTLWVNDGFLGDSCIITSSTPDLQSARFDNTTVAAAGIQSLVCDNSTSSLTVVGPATQASVAVAGSLGFGGDGCCLELGAIELDFSRGFTGFSFEGWVYFDSTGYYSRIFDLRIPGGHYLVLTRVGVSADLALLTSATATTATAAGFIENGRWCHIAVTIDEKGLCRIYRNGIEMLTQQLAVLANVRYTSCYVGRSPYEKTDRYFAGQMAELRLWTLARSAEEIQRTMNTRLTGAEPGLLRYLRLDETAGAIARDRSGHADAKIVGTPCAYGLAGPTLDDAADAPGGLRFDGSRDGLQLPLLSADFAQGFTIEAWVYFDAQRNWEAIVDLGSGAANDNILLSRYQASNDLILSVFQGNSSSALQAAGVLQSGQWMHVAATLANIKTDADNVRRGDATLYVNGKSRATGRVLAPQSVQRSRCWIGRSSWTGDAPFQGRLAEVRLWTRARTPDELVAAKNGRLLSDELGLLAYYPLDEVDSCLAHDVSPSGLHATLATAPRWRQPAPPQLVSLRPPGAGLLFSGADTFVELPKLTEDFSQGFTIEAWVCFDGLGTWERILDLGGGERSDNILLSRAGATNDLNLSVFQGSSDGVLRAAGVIERGRWMHVAATLANLSIDSQGRPQGDATLYVNGVSCVTGKVLAPRNVTRSTCYIGKSNWSGDGLFQGRLAEVRLWTRARTQSELVKAMNGPLLGNEEQLVRYYPLSESTGPLVADRSLRPGTDAAARAGTILGSVQRLTLAAPPTTAGYTAFDGHDDCVALGAFDTDLSIGLTLELWAYLDEGVDSACLLELGGGGESLVLSVAAGGRSLRFQLYRGGSVAAELSAGSALQVGQWMHLAVTLDGVAGGRGTLTLWRDGTSVGSSSSFPAPQKVARPSCFLGKSGSSAAPPLRGRLADLRIFDRARSQDDLARDLAGPPSGNAAGLCRYLPLDEGAGNTARDLARLDGTRIGGAAFTALPHRDALLFTPDFSMRLPELTEDFSRGFTIEAWVCFTSNDSYARIVDLGCGESRHNIIFCRQGTSDDLELAVYSGVNGDSVTSITAKGVLTLGAWMHVAATLDGVLSDGNGSGSIYVNGELKVTGRIGAPRAGIARGSSFLGRSNWVVDGPFRGRMSEVRIWSLARSREDLVNLMRQPLAGSEPGLCRLYRLDDEPGLVIRDSAVAGGGNAGTSLPGQRPSLYFGGSVSDYVLLPAFNPRFEQGLTIEAWVYFSDAGSYARIVDFGNSDHSDSIILCRQGTSNVLDFEICNGSGNINVKYRSLTVENVIQINTWMHVAATMAWSPGSGLGTACLYVNGTLKARRTDMNVPATRLRSIAYVGKSSWDADAPFKGRIAELRIWTRARSQSEIASQMNLALSGSEAGLYRYHRFDTAPGIIAIDSSSARMHAEVYGSQRQPSRLRPDGRAVEFDGANGRIELPGQSVNLSQGFTIEAWVEKSGEIRPSEVFCVLGGGPTATTIVLWGYGAESALCLTVVNSQLQGSLLVPNTLVSGTWMHLAATCDAQGNVALYKNGVRIGAGRLQGDFQEFLSQPLASCLGMRSNYSGQLLGRLSELRLWSSVRSEAEIVGAMSVRLRGSEPGLLRYYPLTDGWGGIVRDGIVHAPAQLAGSPQRIVRALTGAANPAGPGALELDGVCDYVALPMLRADLSGGFTIEAWVRCDGIQKDARIIELGCGESADFISLGRVGTTTNLMLEVRRGTQASTLTAAGVLADGKWVHFAASCDAAGTLSIYVNGALTPATRSVGPQFAPSAGIARSRSYLGKSSRELALFKGGLAEVRIWSRARTAAEIGAAMISSIAQEDPALVAYYRLDESAGDVVHDASRAGLNGALRGQQAGWRAPAPQFLPAPDAQGALVFSGQNDWVSLPPIAADFSRGFTLECWVYYQGNEYWAALIDLGRGLGVDNLLFARYAGSNRLALRIYRGTSYTEILSAGDVLRTDAWLHLAATLDASGQVALYVNGDSKPITIDGVAGARIDAGRMPTAGVTRHLSYLGCSNWPADKKLRGRLAEVRIWTLARSKTAIQQQAAARLIGTEAGLVACYRLNERVGERVGDSGPGALHGYLRGAGRWDLTGVVPALAPRILPQGVLRLGGTSAVTLPELEVSPSSALELTLEAWVCCGDLSKSGRFIDLGNRSGGVVSDNVFLGNDGNAIVFGVQVGSGAVQVAKAFGLAVNEWTHIAAVIDRYGQVTLCKNGTPLSVDINVLNLPAAVRRAQVSLGQSPTGTPFIGALTEVRIFASARTPRQIREAQRVRLRDALPGLLRCYPLLGTRGPRIVDTSPAHKDGVVQGAAVWDVAGPELNDTLPGAPAPATAGALGFDGASTYVTLPEITAELSKGFTIEAWVQFRSAANWAGLVDLGQGEAAHNILLARYGTSDRLVLRIYHASGYNEIISVGAVLQLGVFQHVAVTLDESGRVAFYVNGASVPIVVNGVASDCIPTTQLPAPGLVRGSSYLGKSSWIRDRLYCGSLAEVRLWDRARSAAEIGATKSARLLGSEPGLFGCYRLDERSGARALNRSWRMDAGAVMGDALWGGSPPALTDLATVQPPPPAQLASSAIVQQVMTAPASPPAGAQALPSGVTGNPTVDGQVSSYALAGFELLGVRPTITFTGGVSCSLSSRVTSLYGEMNLTLGGATYALGAGKVTVDAGSDPVLYTARTVPNTGPTNLAAQLVTSALQPTPIWPVVSGVLMPFLELYKNAVLLIASGSGRDGELGDFRKGLNLYATLPLATIPGLSQVAEFVKPLQDPAYRLVLWVNLPGSPTEPVHIEGALQLKLGIELGPIGLTFNEIGIRLDTSLLKQGLGVRYRYTVRLFGEDLQFEGGLGLEQNTGKATAVVWGALMNENWQPWGIPGLKVSGLGLQASIGSPISVGARGAVDIAGVTGGSLAINFEPLILSIDKPDGLGLLPFLDLIKGFSSLLDLSALQPLLDLRLKNLHIYIAPDGGKLAGKTYDAGFSVNATLDLWGYHADLYGVFSKTSGGTLTGHADRLKIEGAGVTLLQLSDVAGELGPTIDLALSTARQGIYCNARVKLLGGIYDTYERLTVDDGGVSLQAGSALGDLSLALNWKSGVCTVGLFPTLDYGFSVAGISVHIDVDAEITNRVDTSGYSQTLRFHFDVCGLSFDVGPVSWGVTLTDLESMVGVFDWFFGDLVKSFFKNTLARAFIAAFDWVRDNVTALAEEAVELFRAAGAATAEIAKNVYRTFNVAADEVIGFLGSSLNEAATLLRDALGLAAREAAEALGVAFAVSSEAVKSALGFAGYAADEIASVADTVWDAIDDFVSYLDPTDW